MSFFIGNQEKFQPNLSVHNINTGNKHNFHWLVADLLCFQKGASYSGIRIFNSLPQSIINLKNEKTHFKVALKKFLNAHLFYSVDEFFTCMGDTSYWLLFKCIFHYNIFVCLYVYDKFHILLSCGSQRSMECIYVCMYVIFSYKKWTWLSTQFCVQL